MSKQFTEAFFESTEELIDFLDLIFVENEEIFYNFKMIDALRGATFETSETLCKDDAFVIVLFAFEFDKKDDTKVRVKAEYEHLSLEAHGKKDEHGDYVFELV